MPDPSENSYKQIIKATSIFGGVQVFNILIAIIRSKVIAILLGPAGMGIIGLLSSTTSLISSVSNFGLGISAVKDIANAFSTGDHKRVGFVASVFKRLVWLTGILGMIITLVMSSWLSEITFGNKNYTWSFILISVTLLLGQLNSGQLVILQGTRHLKWLAKANIYSSLLSLILTLPLYYLYGEKSIVPALIMTSLVSLIVSSFFSRKLNITNIKVSFSEIKIEGREMLKMGLILSISGLITVLSGHLVRIFISYYGNVTEVGLFNAGFSIISTYVGMVFTAMSTDYFPRLSLVAHDDVSSAKTVNEQAEIALLILGPILVAFMIFGNFAVQLLYSEEFIPITQMLIWSVLGMYFKAASWSMGFLFLAKGDSKNYFWNELFANIYMLLLNIAGYYFGGLEGLGISFLIGYILYYIQVYLIIKYLYGFKISREHIVFFSTMLAFGLSAFLLVKMAQPIYYYAIGSILIIVTLALSVKHLDRKLHFLKNFKRK